MVKYKEHFNQVVLEMSEWSDDNVRSMYDLYWNIYEKLAVERMMYEKEIQRLKRELYV